ncbi:Glu/Leu/Phe/Val dehydrogenase [Candidatus Woesearchaeota archaeon]|nr:Glu/Leu/Phe/Val dehydrogenase [Candidatus Woesearchaeota archaeon]
MIEHDEFGPEKILEVSDADTGMHGFLVIDNTVLGPGKGGIRMTSGVNAEEVFRLARTMTWKCALAELPFGGAKSGLIIEKGISLDEKKKKVEAFSRALKPVCPSQYIAAPDINCGEKEMKWFAEANSSMKSCTGKPADMGGLPHELGSTGFGVAHSADVAAKSLGIGKNVAIQGFGNVGQFAAKFLAEIGYTIIAVSDSKGCIYNPGGLDVSKLISIKKETRSVVNYNEGEVLDGRMVFELDADIIIPAAIADVINKDNADKIKAKLIVEGANISITDSAKEILHSRGIFVVPDMIANAGGVISSYVEHIGGNEDETFKMIEEKVRKNTKLIIEHAQTKRIKPHDAGIEIAKQRIREAKK